MRGKILKSKDVLREVEREGKWGKARPPISLGVQSLGCETRARLVLPPLVQVKVEIAEVASARSLGEGVATYHRKEREDVA